MRDNSYKMSKYQFDPTWDKVSVLMSLIFCKKISNQYLLYGEKRSSGHKERSKIRTWPWPLTFWPKWRSKVKGANAKVSSHYLLRFLSFSGICEIKKYKRGDNSYKESSDPFDRNVTKLRKNATNNLVATFFRYLFTVSKE